MNHKYAALGIVYDVAKKLHIGHVKARIDAHKDSDRVILPFTIKSRSSDSDVVAQPYSSDS